MADVKLGSSYVGAKSDATTYTADDDKNWYRGYKDFLVYKQSGPANPRITITRRDTESNLTLKATLYEVSNVLQDPGTQRQQVTNISTGSSHTFSLQPHAQYPESLYRIRIEPNDNKVDFTVKIEDIQYYALEAWEPRFNFYVHGRSGQTAMEQYFFIPGDAGTVKVRLETEKSIEQARLEVFQITPTEQSKLVITAKGQNASGTDNAYFATGTFTAAAGGSGRASGQLYKFKLTDPNSTGQGQGNIWVRFSRNVPPYFANDYRRLMVPIVHREFDPVLYTNQTQTYRTYLSVDRGIPGIGSSDTLKITISGQTSTTTSGYVTSLNYTSSGSQNKLTGMLAQLESGGSLVAASTDKVDAIYTVNQPTWGTWPNPSYLMYDGESGQDAQELSSRQYDTIQTDITSTLDGINTYGMKAMGVLYANQSMKDLFASTPDDTRVRFWALFDEVDSGPGANGPMKLLKEAYDEYYNRKTKPTTKPLSVNIMHAFAMEEYAEGCDYILTDPYVKTTTDNNTKRITEWMGAAKAIVSGLNSSKRICIILWAWEPPTESSIISPTSLYSTEHGLVKGDASIQGIATYKWAGGGGQLNQTGFTAGIALWSTIDTLNTPR